MSKIVKGRLDCYLPSAPVTANDSTPGRVSAILPCECEIKWDGDTIEMLQIFETNEVTEFSGREIEPGYFELEGEAEEVLFRGTLHSQKGSPVLEGHWTAQGVSDGDAEEGSPDRGMWFIELESPLR